jgi:hypothetical protein
MRALSALRGGCDSDEESHAQEDAVSCHSAPFLSWQEDLSRKLGGVMRKLHM